MTATYRLSLEAWLNILCLACVGHIPDRKALGWFQPWIPDAGLSLCQDMGKMQTPPPQCPALIKGTFYKTGV
jgi:hypothetical protein